MARLRAAARRFARPALARIGDGAAGALRSELEANRREVAELRDELHRTRSELRAELELLRAELDGR